MRLNQFISIHSKFSRRESDRLLQSGRVKIGHKIADVATQIPQEILENPRKNYKNFRIFIDNKELFYHKDSNYTAIVYHKPKGELVSRVDSKNRRLIYDGLGARYKHFMPVGRLDFASEGVLILSDSKEVVKKLMESSLPRIYSVKIDCKINEKMIKAMNEGLTLKDARKGGHKLSKIKEMSFAPMEFEIIKNANISKLKIMLKEGKNRELRRFFAHFNATILDLVRLSYGFIHLNHLKAGKMRFFSKQEYEDLREFMEYGYEG